MTTVPQQQPSSKQTVDGDDDRKPSSAVLALSDLLSNLPKTVPLANDSAGLRTSFALVDQIKMALQDPSLPFLPKPPASTDLAPLPLVEMISSVQQQRASASPSKQPEVDIDMN